MRAPRRTPYEGPKSLDHLYNLLYPEEHFINIDNEAYRQQRNQGIAIVHLWLNRSSCPFAVESSSSLIQAQQLDEQLVLLNLLPSHHQTGSEWIVRSAYAMAILRFVNSVADTFQTSMYAQSIFQISQRIGLPIWLVELRHAATHEELPSLEVLRDACITSLQWLQVHFWRPTLARRNLSRTAEGLQGNKGRLSSSLESVDVQKLQLEVASELRQHLASYRRLAKSVVRDESLRGRSKTALLVAQNKIETCAKKAEAALGQSRGVVGQDEEWDADQDDVTAAALLVDALLEAGGLIPLSKKKRSGHQFAGADSIADIPRPLFQTWLPLLNHLSASVDNFADVLQDGLVQCITQPSSTTGKSFLDTAASWTIALFGEDKPTLSASKLQSRHQLFSELSEDDDGVERDRPTILLARRCLTFPTAISLAVARQLCAKDERLLERVKPLLEMAELNSKEATTKGRELGQEQEEEAKLLDDGQLGPQSDLEDSILEMERKLQELQDKPLSSQSAPQQQQQQQHQQSSLKATERHQLQIEVCQQIPGWQVAPNDWKPSPIGCLDGSVPNLVL